VTKTTPSIPWFTAIQGIKGKHDLGNLAPEGCFISAETIEREVGQISKTQKATCELDSRAEHGSWCTGNAVRCRTAIDIDGVNAPE
jgi:hypothetical protein